MARNEQVDIPAPGWPAADPWGDAVAAFLSDLLDHSVEVTVHTDAPDFTANGDRFPADPQLGADGRTRQFSVSTTRGEDGGDSAARFPPELEDLPGAALRALARVTQLAACGLPYPSVARALHDVVVAEVIADRLRRRSAGGVELDALVMTVAGTIDYFAELAATPLEGAPVTHGIVIASDPTGVEAPASTVAYPGRLHTRKRTPLLFDGTQSALVVDMLGRALRGVERSTLPLMDPEPSRLETFDELPGLDGALTAAASAAFHGVGFYLRGDPSTWIFDDGSPLFVRRGLQWKSIAFDSFTRTLAELGGTTEQIGQRIARSALRLSMQGRGAILAIATDAAALVDVTEPRDRAPVTGYHGDSVDDDLRQLLRLHDVSSPAGLARLARLDGATIVDTTGQVIAYGAIVRSTDSQTEGARSAAARTLSTAANVTLSVSHDGPITVYRGGRRILEIL
ncbi:MAG TPA: hypothetical protein PLV68_02980 [Ilumatobacteraceae bacterium]|nr:hypothetical protein [Ilumatobacteraceae bacterium]